MKKSKTLIYRKHHDVWKHMRSAPIYRHGKKIYWFVGIIVAILVAFAIFTFIFFVPLSYEINAWAGIAVASIILLLIMIVVRHVIIGIEVGKVRRKFEKVKKSI